MGHKHGLGANLRLQVSIQPNIGLDGDTRAAVIGILNTLLSDEAVLTMKTRGASWHMRGPGILNQQPLFERLFQELNRVPDEIAERVNMLGGFAISSFEEFLDTTRLAELPGEAPDMMSLLADHETCIRYLRDDSRKCVDDYDDQGSFALLVRILRLHEKMAWVLRSHIEPVV